MVVETAVRTRLLLDTQEGPVELVERAPDEWAPARVLCAESHAGQRYMRGYCLTRDADGRTLYVAGASGVRRSEDGGTTWRDASAGLRLTDIWGLEAHPVRPGTVFAGAKAIGIFRSDDGGASWQETDIEGVPGQAAWYYPIAPHTPQARTFAFDPRDPDWIYAGIEEGGVLLSRDGGRTWEPRGEGLTWPATAPTPAPDVHALLVDPLDPDIVHCTTGFNYHISRDRGATWAPGGKSLVPDYTRALAADRTRQGRLLVGTSLLPPNWLTREDSEARQWGVAQARLWESLDHGATWQPIAGGLPEVIPHIIGAIAQHPRAPLRWFLSTVGGEVWTSDDGAATWRLLAADLPPAIDLLLE